jgi:hypothetical protein
MKSNHDDDAAPSLPESDTKRLHQAPSLNHVDSIVEDEEELHSGNSISAKSNLSPRDLAIPPTSYTTDKNGRFRSLSTSQVSQTLSTVSRKSSWNSSLKIRQAVPQRRDLPGSKHLEVPEKSPRTRKVQLQIENMDLDDVMNGLDEEINGSAPQPPSSYKVPTRAVTGRTVSSGARELIDFLDEGPPEDMQSARLDGMATSSKSKSGRLQRMMLRLKGGSSTERLREEPNTSRKAAAVLPPETPKSATLPRQSPNPLPYTSSVRTYPNVIIGTPPRPPRLVKQLTEVLPPDENERKSASSPTKLARKAVPSIDLVRESTTVVPPSRQSSRPSPTESKDSLVSPSAGRISTNGYVNGNVTNGGAKDPRESSATTDDTTMLQKHASKRQTEVTTSAPLLTTDRVDQLRRLLSNATTADECRVLVDMFLARIGFPVNRPNNDDPYGVPTPDPTHDALEKSVVGLLLDGTAGVKPPSPMKVEALDLQNIESPLSTVRPRLESPAAPDTQLRQHSPRTLVVG